MTLDEWFTEGPRRARENGGTIVLTRREYDDLVTQFGRRFNMFLGYPIEFAKPYDWARDVKVVA